MASKLEEDISCPVCTEIFKDPVLLSCSHSFCKACLQQFWGTKESRECPVCRRSSQEEPPTNLALKNLCETFIQERDYTQMFCKGHKRKFELLCLDDQQLVCLVCRDSKLHKNHSFSPTGEAASEMKVSLFGHRLSAEQHLLACPPLSTVDATVPYDLLHTNSVHFIVKP